MKTEERVLVRVDQLAELGQRVLGTRCPPPSNVCDDDSVDMQLALQWITSVQAFLVSVFGESSRYFVNFTQQADQRYPSYSHIEQGYGILLAARDDLMSGALFEIKSLVEAELFDDLLEQAEHLLSAGYHQPAAVVAGAVLEDGLRKLCSRNDIDLGDRQKLDRMNAELAKQGVYNKLTQKRITALADIRNSAAHGDWDGFTKDDVSDMIGSIRRFMEEQLS